MFGGARTLYNGAITIANDANNLKLRLYQCLTCLNTSLLLLGHDGRGASRRVGTLGGRFLSVGVSFVPLSLDSVVSMGTTARTLCSTYPSVVVRGTKTCDVPHCVANRGISGIFRVGFLTPCCVAHTLLPGLHRGGNEIIVINDVTRGCSGAGPSGVSFTSIGTTDGICNGTGQCLVLSFCRLFGGRGGIRFTIARPNVAFAGVATRCPGLVFTIVGRPVGVVFVGPGGTSLYVLGNTFSGADCNR